MADFPQGFNLNDPLLQIILQNLARAEAGAAQPTMGITPALQQGAYPVSSGPMGTVGLNQPLNVSPERAATLSPLEQQLSQAANMRAFAQPDADRLAFEQSTLGFLEGIDKENAGVFDRRMAAKAQMEKEAADRELEYRKVIDPRKLDIAAGQAKSEEERRAKLEEAYLRGITEIMKPSDMIDPKAQKEAADAFTARYRLLLDNPSPSGTPQNSAKAVVERYRKQFTDQQIKSLLAEEVAKNPQKAQVARLALQYLDSTGTQSGSKAGSPVLVMGQGKAAQKPQISGGSGAPPSNVLSAEEKQAAIELREKLRTVVPTAKQKGQQALEGLKSGLEQDLSSLGWAQEKISAFIEVLIG